MKYSFFIPLLICLLSAKEFILIGMQPSVMLPYEGRHQAVLDNFREQVHNMFSYKKVLITDAQELDKNLKDELVPFIQLVTQDIINSSDKSLSYCISRETYSDKTSLGKVIKATCNLPQANNQLIFFHIISSIIKVDSTISPAGTVNFNKALTSEQEEVLKRIPSESSSSDKEGTKMIELAYLEAIKNVLKPSANSEEPFPEKKEKEKKDEKEEEEKNFEKESSELAKSVTELQNNLKKAQQERDEAAKKKAQASESHISLPRVLIGLGIGGAILSYIYYHTNKKSDEKQSAVSH